MFDPFVQAEWQELCERLNKCAKGIARDSDKQADFVQKTEKFADQPAPERYPELLERTAEAARLAVEWQGTRNAAFAHDDALVDEAGDESFPARDPPTFSHAHA
ncbi:hypothetical protein [Planctomycetes bacterium K23_9]|uniref:Uncharacterized protein n=1 Tax=Stieleria marina TaxID=1930275 RepID=A0A517P029_9BACT|nr:hypothetical protein K239x_47370 [Planctomycetes bacterium K23_9]